MIQTGVDVNGEEGEDNTLYSVSRQLRTNAMFR
jgi:hypothetical protein